MCVARSLFIKFSCLSASWVLLCKKLEKLEKIKKENFTTKIWNFHLTRIDVIDDDNNNGRFHGYSIHYQWWKIHSNSSKQIKRIIKKHLVENLGKKGIKCLRVGDYYKLLSFLLQMSQIVQFYATFFLLLSN